jgi:hypothetical protein
MCSYSETVHFRTVIFWNPDNTPCSSCQPKHAVLSTISRPVLVNARPVNVTFLKNVGNLISDLKIATMPRNYLRKFNLS